MKEIRYLRATLAGLAGGVAGFLGINAGFAAAAGILLDPRFQSPKLIAVWTTLEPLPRAVTGPAPVIAGFLFLGILHGLVFAMVAPALPGRGWRKGIGFAVVLFVLETLFFEFYTPWNMFHEPIPLVLLELACWIPGVLAEGIAIALVYRAKD